MFSFLEKSRKIQSVFYDLIIWLIVHFIAQQMTRVYLPIHSQAFLQLMSD